MSAARISVAHGEREKLGRAWLVRKAALAGALFVLVAVPALFFAVAVGVGTSSLLAWLSTWASTGVFAIGAGACLGRARAVAVNRSAWSWFAVACACWTGANLYYAVVVAPAPLPLPSPADLGYVTFPLALAVGLVQYARTRLSRIPADVWLDGLVAAFGTAAIASAVVFRIVDVRTSHLSGVITTFVYPLEDVAVLGVLVGVCSLLGWRIGRGLGLITVAIVSITAADMILFTRVLEGSSVGGAWSNLGWTAGIGLIVASAWHRWRSAAVDPTPPSRDQLALPVVFAIGALAVLALGWVVPFSPASAIFAVAALAASCARLFRSFSEIRALADSRRLAITDELTDLPNRRRLLRDLERVCAERRARVLALFDLDGFKRYNDTYGHPDGDRRLVDLSASLRRAVAGSGEAYRLGGDEFCVLVDATDEGSRVIEAATFALTDSAPGWSITASFGTVELPREADTVAEALRIADQRMYAQKDRRPAAARQQARDVLLTALGEQQPTLRVHVRDVTKLAGDVAGRLGMPSDDIDDVIRAAELHDVGKLAIPPEILDKPGPLGEAEWELLRQHTIIGERMLIAAPALVAIAPLVRSSHERWDGAGYPDGLAGEDIPLGARIVAVCDAFDAMVSDRPYRAGRSSEEAVAELRRCAGTQFDPRVVDAFSHALAGSTSSLLSASVSV